MDDVDIHLDAGAEHADGVGNTILAVHEEMLPNRMDHVVLSRQVDGLGVLDDVLDIVFRNLAVGRDHGVHAPVRQTLCFRKSPLG